ncbi:MAG: hypothetical protein HY832_03390 [Candidatus Aenigmarchaeota archaeon]|nr:hypothetical protein [Candidatus Aenigmarchaeota archaeon]
MSQPYSNEMPDEERTVYNGSEQRAIRNDNILEQAQRQNDWLKIFGYARASKAVDLRVLAGAINMLTDLRTDGTHSAEEIDTMALRMLVRSYLTKQFADAGSSLEKQYVEKYGKKPTCEELNTEVAKYLIDLLQ